MLRMVAAVSVLGWFGDYVAVFGVIAGYLVAVDSCFVLVVCLLVCCGCLLLAVVF